MHHFANRIYCAIIIKIDVVLKLNDPNLIFKYAIIAKKRDIEVLEQAIIRTGDPKYIYYFF